MRFVEHDPAELPTGLPKDRSILGPHEHVFQHRRVGDQHGGRPVPESFPGYLLCPRSPLVLGRRLLRGLSVVEAEPDVVPEAVAPSPQAVSLAVDERIQRIQEQCAHAGQVTSVCPFPGQILKDRHEEALGLPGACAARDQHRTGDLAEQKPPAFDLMLERLSVTRKPVLASVLARRLVHRGDQIPAKQAASREPLHVRLGELPSEYRFQHGGCQQCSGLAGLPRVQLLQILAQRRRTKAKLGEDGSPGAGGEVLDEIRDADGLSHRRFLIRSSTRAS